MEVSKELEIRRKEREKVCSRRFDCPCGWRDDDKRERKGLLVRR